MKGTRSETVWKSGNNVQLLFFVATGADGATVEEDGRAVEPRQTDHGPWHIFIATNYGHQRIVPLGTGHRFYAVGNHIPARQAETHAVGSHADAVRNTNGVVNQADQVVLFVYAGFYVVGQSVEVHVAGVALPAHRIIA